MKFHTKIFLWYAGLLTLIIIGFSIAVFGVIQSTIVHSIDSRLDSKSSHLIRHMGIQSSHHGDVPTLKMIFGNDDIFRVAGLSIQVWQTHDGQNEISPVLIKSSFDLGNMTTALDASNLNVDSPTYTKVTFHTERQRVMTRPFKTADGLQIGVIQTASSIMIVDQITEGILKAMVITTIIGWIISMGLDMLLSYHALQPIQKITTAVARVSTSNDLTTRLVDTSIDNEVGRLTEAFNHMMSRLESLFSVQQRFVTDLSHELRTPLTTIQGNLDIIQRYGADDTSLQAIQFETKRMTRMVNEVLTLARADLGDIKISLQPLDINDKLASDSVNRITEIAHRQDHRFYFRVNKHNEPVMVNGNYEHLQQVIHNLLMNTIRFTQDGGAIRVSIYAEGKYGIIEVADTGIGIAEENLDRIFDRFYQVDDSRVHTSDNDGAGLGLPIGKWIVEAHRGHIEVKSEINVGTTVRVKLPLLRDSAQSLLPPPNKSHHPATENS